MIAKFGFVLLFAVFGALVFMMGVYLPNEARGRLPGGERMQSDKAAGAGSTPAPAPAAAKAGGEDKTAPLETLQLPATASKTARYTLQLSLFTSQADADALVAQVEALHLPGIKAKTLAVRDRAGQAWWIATAGDQDAPDALESTRVWLGERFALHAMRAIQLPAAPK